MAAFKNQPGDMFNDWTLLKYVGKGKWLCRCKCGVEKEVWMSHLTAGSSRQCNTCKGRGKVVEVGRINYPREYATWMHMKDRCINPNNDRYDSYGGRGIVIDPRWMDFKNFLEDMGLRPEGTTLDRVDVNGMYCKENCRWATATVQQRNRRTIKESSLGCSITELSEKSGLPYCVVQSRIKRGWGVEKALSEPVKDNADSLSAKAREAGIPFGTVRTRIARGWSMEKALNTPVMSNASKCG